MREEVWSSAQGIEAPAAGAGAGAGAGWTSLWPVDALRFGAMMNEKRRWMEISGACKAGAEWVRSYIYEYEYACMCLHACMCMYVYASSIGVGSGDKRQHPNNKHWRRGRRQDATPKQQTQRTTCCFVSETIRMEGAPKMFMSLEFQF